MLAELSELLKVVPDDADAAAYRHAIISDNLLGKKTLATRRLTAQRLAELYGLDPKVPCFRVLRYLWKFDSSGRPMIAFLTAYARDPLLRATIQTTLTSQIGSVITTSNFDAELASKFGDRFNPAVRFAIAQRVSSSWMQAGYYTGRSKKIRSSPVITPSVVTLALLLGYATGIRGGKLFSTEWTRLLDSTPSQILTLTTLAARQSLIDYRHLGDVVELRFPTLLTTEEEAHCHV